MTDPTRYAVDPAALEHDAKQFAEWHAAVVAMADALPVDVQSAAFSMIPGAADALSRVRSAATALHDYLHDGAAEFDDIGSRLTATLRVYTEAEDASISDVARVSREVDSL